jgi:hypothetical protein
MAAFAGKLHLDHIARHVPGTLPGSFSPVTTYSVELAYKSGRNLLLLAHECNGAISGNVSGNVKAFVKYLAGLVGRPCEESVARHAAEGPEGPIRGRSRRGRTETTWGNAAPTGTSTRWDSAAVTIREISATDGTGAVPVWPRWAAHLDAVASRIGAA